MLYSFTLFGHTVPAYGVFLLSGMSVTILCATCFVSRLFGQTREDVLYCGLIAVVAGLAGAKALSILLCVGSITSHPEWFGSPAQIWQFIQSGFVFYGGLIGGCIGGWVYVWRYRLPVLPFMDIAATTLPLGHAIGRFGCFLAGCCYGSHTTCAFGVTFPKSSVHPHGLVSVHPTQLYEAAALLLLFLGLLAFARRKPRQGTTTGLYLALYAMVRFVIEFFRADPRGGVLFLSTSQLISIPLFVAGVLLVSGVFQNLRPCGRKSLFIRHQPHDAWK
jgi:phosphatidylglycerol:prolipoprotein diacylglycerol transferase